MPVLDLEAEVVGLFLANLAVGDDELLAQGAEERIAGLEVFGGDPAPALDPERVLGRAADLLFVVG